MLLIRKKRGLGAGKINAPGGKLEPGETAHDAAVRETREEVGVTPLRLEDRGVVRFQFTDGYSLHCAVFVAADFTGELIETPEATLEQAQVAKKRRLIDKLVLSPGQRALDIGCGWGGLGLSLAEAGAHIGTAANPGRIHGESALGRTIRMIAAPFVASGAYASPGARTVLERIALASAAPQRLLRPGALAASGCSSVKGNPWT